MSTVPKGGRSRQLPMKRLLTGALKSARHLRSERVLCLPDGSPMTRDRVIKAVRGAQRVAGIDQGVHILRHTFCSHLAMKGRAREGHPGAGRARGLVDDGALHAPESGGNGRRDPVA
jgi:integrase